MCLRYISLTLLFVPSISTAALAVMPPMPPMTNGDGNPSHNLMKHAQIGLNGTGLTVHVGDPPPAPVVMTSGFGVSYDAQFSVLDNRWFNSQYGWNPEGIWLPPTGAEVWIKRTGATKPAGSEFRVYEGGRGATFDQMNNPLPDGMPLWSMNERYASDGDKWLWDRIMQHDLYVVDTPGEYSMSFEVYVGDEVTGEPLAGFSSATTTFRFLVPVPAPSAGLLSLIGCGLCAAARRRNVANS